MPVVTMNAKYRGLFTRSGRPLETTEFIARDMKVLEGVYDAACELAAVMVWGGAVCMCCVIFVF